MRSRGFDGFSYADLASAIGIRKASIHYHFPRKSDLGLALMQRYRADLDQQLDAIDASSKTGGERLKRQIRRYRDALGVGDRLCLCVALSISSEAFDDTVTHEMLSFRSRSVDWLRSVFEQGLADQSISNVADPAAEAMSCLAVLEGAHLAGRTQGSVMRFDEAVRLLTDRLAQR